MEIADAFALLGLPATASPSAVDQAFYNLKRVHRLDGIDRFSDKGDALQSAHKVLRAHFATLPRYVAMVDVLGFRELVMAQPPKATLAMLAKLGSKAAYLSVESMQFSDSILLYTSGVFPGDLTRMVTSLARLMGSFAESGLFLRAGLTAGEFSHPNHGRLFVGKAMIRAYDLEQAQEWMGGLLDPALLAHASPTTSSEIDALLAAGFLVKYDAPIKGGGVGPVHCIGWPKNFRGKVITLTSTDHSWNVMRKSANTQRFLEFYRSKETEVPFVTDVDEDAI